MLSTEEEDKDNQGFAAPQRRHLMHLCTHSGDTTLARHLLPEATMSIVLATVEPAPASSVTKWVTDKASKSANAQTHAVRIASEERVAHADCCSIFVTAVRFICGRSIAQSAEAYLE